MKYKDLPKNNIETTLKLIGGKWKILIVDSLLDGTKRFNQIKNDLKGITQRVLSSALKELEKDGILEKKIYNVLPPKVEYTLTDIGQSMAPIVKSLNDWGKDYKKYIKLLEKMSK